MDLLTGLVYATVIAIALVIVHGFYRKWSDRRNRVIVKLERNIPQADIDLDLLPNSELPNGRARTLPRETEPVIPRRRYQLKDGRDKIRQNEPEPEPANVPVLMDPLEIAETEIEHANVFVTAETQAQESAAPFADEELPPEVMAGLDGEFHEPAAAAAGPAAGAASGDCALDDTDGDDQADEFLAATRDPLSDEDELSEEFPEEFDGEFEDENAEQHAREVHAAAAEAANNQPGEELSGHGEGDAGYEDEEEYDPYEDENFYENEPALLENAYKLATRKFQRHQEPEAPRIEPGFGEAQGEEVETSEEFTASLSEDVMDEFLDKEQEEIRAWRNQSVTQQDAPPVAAVVIPAVESKPARIEPKVMPVAPVNMVAERMPAAQPTTFPTTSPTTPPTAPPEPLAAPKAADPARENKPSFWQSMTGKTAKTVKAPIVKIAQGELFQEVGNHEQVAPEPTGPQEVVIVNVMAKPGNYFYGDELVPVLQHFGLRLGKMNIFHRHTEPDGTGPVMFSMANMVKPGTFSLNAIEEFATPGISFFVQLPNRHGNMKAFEQMLATANAVKQALDGVLKDERRSVLTRQTVEHCRQRIRDFELSLLAKK